MDNSSGMQYSSALLDPLWARYRLLAFTVVVVVGVTSLTKFVKLRRKYHKLPGPPHSYIFGHLKVMGEIIQSVPRDTHPHGMMTMIHQKYNLGPIFYMDMWPMQVAMVCVVDPAVATQVTQINSLDKHPNLRHFVKHLTGDTGMVITNGEIWKTMRSMFNPGFASAHLMTLMDGIIDDTLTFCGILDRFAQSKEIMYLEEATTRLTVDIIGRVVLDHHLDAQRTENRFLTLFRKTVNRTPTAYEMNPFVNYNPINMIYKWYYGREMDRYIADILEKRYSSQAKNSKQTRRKPAIDLALDEFRSQQKELNKTSDLSGTNPLFKRAVQDQMKTFIFAGHDTSSSTLCYAYHLLNLHPEKMKLARKELDEVLGSDISAAPAVLKANPQLINQLPYLLAIIKETLRIYPAASSARAGGNDTTITVDGQVYPANNIMVWVVSHTIGHREDLFPSAKEFIPERFLNPPNNFQNVVEGAWRPFEKGLRGCIGQELAILEMKVILALTLRSYDISEAYEEHDRRLGREAPGSTLGGKRGMFGSRMYQQLIASAKPTESMPARVVKLH